MLHTLAVSQYRSLREIVMPLGQLTLVTGPNGSGKSNLYRALSLLRDAGRDRLLTSIASEGGWGHATWAGPDTLSRRMRLGDVPIEGTVRKSASRIRLGVAGDDMGYLVEIGLPTPPVAAEFALDPSIKREVIWRGGPKKPSRVEVERAGATINIRRGRTLEPIRSDLWGSDSCLSYLPGTDGLPSFWALRHSMNHWRFHDGFRTDADAPARRSMIGTRTPLMAEDGSDLAAAVATILDIGDRDGFAWALQQAFPGSTARVAMESHGALSLLIQQPGMLRPLRTHELSDGTLRYLMLITSLLSPRPPALMVLNEPENSLHPTLVQPLGYLLRDLAATTQVWVISHNAVLCDILRASSLCVPIELEKEYGETRIDNIDPLELPPWTWT